MPIEIERKFLIRNNAWRKQAGTGINYVQGYIAASARRAVRIRIAGRRAFVSFKGKITAIRRKEYEYEVPPAEAREMLSFFCARPPVEKIRYRVKHGGKTWEVDEFLGENEGLTVAEIELEREDEYFEIPDWVGEEVTRDPRYLSVNLYKKPYKTWPQK
ncbi:MAG: CYTH domain-containing protein [Syntrophales bacterium]|nr:CYTH domain-containing protein [Syntrophales bacterium]MDD5232830.1 CYTH domain-containing protein [Syntrophales bacterium]MDD5531871.1 CYTH domain-containing protein [Syntrophales bacterium]HPL63673.1 CYTH domain-containing protein [Syntrophales bacterium]